MAKGDKTEGSPAEEELRLPDIHLDDRDFQPLVNEARAERAEEEESAPRVPFHDTETPMAMRIEKMKIVDFLRARGREEEAKRAEEELPDPVDTDEHAGLLRGIGIDPEDPPIRWK